MNGIVFVVKNDIPMTIWYIKQNPTYDDIAHLKNLCSAMDGEKYTLVCLDDNELNKLKYFIN